MHLKRSRCAAGLLILSGLAACGGGGSEGTTLALPDTDIGTETETDFSAQYVPIGVLGDGPMSFGEAATWSTNAIWWANQSAGAGQITRAHPAVSSAVYDGGASHSWASDTSDLARIYLGRIRMTADFTSGRVDGQISQYTAAPLPAIDPSAPPSSVLVPVTGNLTISGTTAGAALTASLAGTIEGRTVTGTMRGDFGTDTASGIDVVGGAVDVVLPGITPGVDYSGTFVAARQ